MIRSMTGFGAGRAEQGGEAVAVEVRSVNGKFCEVRARLPRELPGLEPTIAKAVKARIARGVVDVTVRREGAGALAGSVPQINLPLAAAYAKALREMQSELGLSGELGLSDLVALDGVVGLTERAPDTREAEAAALAAVEKAISALEEMRGREGESLARDLRARLDAIEAHAGAVRELSPKTVEAYRDRLAARVSELSRGTAADPARLAQEVAFFAERVDIAEELTRLQSHLSQMRALLDAGGPVGRKLEFLVQELNREVNTVGSKSQNTAISARVVDLKAELERVREQIANVE
ncbi:MAG: YicC family protein [Deltaproteobacteria bacterium]|nr:MAG: YicC family protein [Deltaproteobacteria bacterium]TMB38522.1 MAG: YicC family protein [Deltaproteobacteria bacterium]